MENFGLADLAWILGMLAAAAFLMGGGIGASAALMRKGWAGFVNRYVALPVSPPAEVTRSQTSPMPAGPPQQDQAGLDRSAISFDMIADYLARHNLTDEQLIILYARAHRAPDDYPLSANKIRDAVGGGRDDVLAAIAAQRPKPKQQPPRRLERPVNGW